MTTLFLYYPISMILPFLINFFKKNFHSLFNLTTTTTQSHSVSSSGLSLLLTEETTATIATAAVNNNNNVLNVLQSTKFNSISRPNNITDVDVDEFESFDNERRVNDRIDDENDEIWRRKMLMMKKAEKSSENRIRSYPPPLSSLNRNGKPNFYLRPVRKNGRLELTEVRIQRPDIIHASRHDGRLTLHLIPDREEDEEDNGICMVVGNSNERLRCHEMVNQRNFGVHGNHIRMCGISIV